MNFPENHVLTLEAKEGIARELHTPLRVLIPNDHSKHAEVFGLWDTGATGSAITNRVVQLLGLVPTGMIQVQTAGGTFVKNTYTIDFVLPNSVLIQGIMATELDGVVGSNSDVLIGMDVITLGDFAITNFQGKTVMSFRVPSCEKIDFADQTVFRKSGQAEFDIRKPLAAPRTPIRIGRNDRCHCGSGKKYKHCHGR